MKYGTISSPRRAGAGFTLIELMVSVTFLVILMLVVSQVIGIVQRSWVRTNSRVSQFREARRAFDVISRNLSQATLNTYWKTELTQVTTDKLGQGVKSSQEYQRTSELQFVCGPTSDVLSGATGQNFPGHAVFFQAPLGITKLKPVVSATSTTETNTENMVNLLCGRGYFVEWGSDSSFRPTFLQKSPFNQTVPTRNRLRLMEYSPTAEMNSIYASVFRPITDKSNSRQWYQNSKTGALATEVKDGKETAQTRYFTRPVAENILALIISPQYENQNANGNPDSTVYNIAPSYLYDSVLKGDTSRYPSGTQHTLPPIIQVSMIALDERSAEMLSSEDNKTLRESILQKVSKLFTTANKFNSDLEGTAEKPGDLRKTLLTSKINYRVFTTSISLAESRFSF